MTRLRVLIVDDEPAARGRLARLLDALDVEIVGEAGEGLSALELVRTRAPDLILLDIAMPEVDGFDVARHLPEPRPLVIFQTAYAEFALKAFEHDALDYVVKPVTRARLATAIERARRRLADRPAARWTAQDLAQLGDAIRHRPPLPERLLVRHGAEHKLVPLSDILRFSAAEGLVYAHTRGRPAGTDYTLQELETRLASAFVRISRGDLVNVAAVDAVAGNGDGSATLTLRDGTRLHVSRRRSAGVRASLGQSPAARRRL